MHHKIFSEDSVKIGVIEVFTILILEDVLKNLYRKKKIKNLLDGSE